MGHEEVSSEMPGEITYEQVMNALKALGLEPHNVREVVMKDGNVRVTRSNRPPKGQGNYVSHEEYVYPIVRPRRRQQP